MTDRRLPKVGDVVKVTYFGVVTEVRKSPKFLPHFELDNNPTRHVLDELSEITVYDDPAVGALMSSFNRVDRDF